MTERQRDPLRGKWQHAEEATPSLPLLFRKDGEVYLSTTGRRPFRITHRGMLPARLKRREVLFWVIVVVVGLGVGFITAPGAPLGWCWGGCR